VITSNVVINFDKLVHFVFEMCFRFDTYNVDLLEGLEKKNDKPKQDRDTDKKI